MPMHDWTRVEAGIFHAFHHGWVSTICAALNLGVLSDDHYALPEQVAADIGPDVFVLRDRWPDEAERYRRPARQRRPPHSHD
jgi:hypothetical protein